MRLRPDKVDYWEGALQLLFYKLCLKMIDHGSRRKWVTGPLGSKLQIWKCNLLLPKTGVPYNFCFIKFSQKWMVEAADACWTQFGAPLTPRVGVWGWIPAMNLSCLEEYSHAKFLQDQSSGLDFIPDTHTHTHTHTLTFIY